MRHIDSPRSQGSLRTSDVFGTIYVQHASEAILVGQRLMGRRGNDGMDQWSKSQGAGLVKLTLDLGPLCDLSLALTSPFLF